ncbi:MAG: very large tegument protein [Labilithrix sp.]|nr:very large tegument protein [Labilithrix sp.]
MIDCSTFHDCELDALYSDGGDAAELDAEGKAAMAEHVASCADCAARLERLRRTRHRILSVAVEPVPQDFESRIMAAVDAGLARRAASSPALVAASPMGAAHRGPEPQTGGAKILRFMSRPSFAVAATFVLVLGAGAILMTRSRSMKSTARSDEAPAAVAASPAPAASAAQSPAEDRDDLALATATAPLSPPAAVAAAPAAGGPPPMMAAKAAKPPLSSAADDRAFTSAKALYAANRCAEALPKFEALKANIPEAELYAARCIAKTRGCTAAAPRFDQAAQANAGTEAGSRAQIEGARCYQSTGDLVAARKRLEAAKDEGVLAAEAEQSLDALDGKPGAGTPSGGVHAAPRAPARPSAPAAAPPAKR